MLFYSKQLKNSSDNEFNSIQFNSFSLIGKTLFFHNKNMSSILIMNNVFQLPNNLKLFLCKLSNFK